jgi:hypothetical protein
MHFLYGRIKQSLKQGYALSGSISEGEVMGIDENMVRNMAAKAAAELAAEDSVNHKVSKGLRVKRNPDGSASVV